MQIYRLNWRLFNMRIIFGIGFFIFSFLKQKDWSNSEYILNFFIRGNNFYKIELNQIIIKI